jgi:hypothetical protein
MDDVELKRELERAHADCFGWAMACCGRDRDDAEEVLQTVYLTVLDGRARYDGRSSFRTWLFGVIRLTAASERRKAWLRGLLLERGSGRRGFLPRIAFPRRTRRLSSSRGDKAWVIRSRSLPHVSVRFCSSCSITTSRSTKPPR